MDTLLAECMAIVPSPTTITHSHLPIGHEGYKRLRLLTEQLQRQPAPDLFNRREGKNGWEGSDIQYSEAEAGGY